RCVAGGLRFARLGGAATLRVAAPQPGTAWRRRSLDGLGGAAPAQGLAPPGDRAAGRCPATERPPRYTANSRTTPARSMRATDLNAGIAAATAAARTETQARSQVLGATTSGIWNMSLLKLAMNPEAT